MTLRQNQLNSRTTRSLSFMCQGENSCCIQSWLVHQGPSCQATIQRCMGPSWQTAANEAEVVGRVRVLQKRAMQPLFSCLTHLELHLQAPITLVLICICNLIYFLPILRVYQQSRLTQPHLLHHRHLPKRRTKQEHHTYMLTQGFRVQKKSFFILEMEV